MGKVLNNLASFPVVFVKGDGATLTDSEGKQYIDFVAGIGVNCLGHNHPALVRSLSEQAARQIHVSNYYTSDTGLQFADALLEQTGMEQVFFGNSGAEANESAIKLARKYGFLNGGEGRKTIITLNKSFHGRTLASLTATGQDVFHSPAFSPYPEGFCYINAHDYTALKTAFTDSVCAVLFECIQGEGGVNLIDTAWAQAVCDAARKAGALVMVDEVQTGIGRTGTFLAAEQLGITPDVITLAKGIAGGVPMGAMLVRGKAAGVFVAGDHQSTFGGNPLACAGGVTVLAELNKSGFLDAVQKKGAAIRTAISGWNLSCVKEVRGRGLMIGIDIDQDAGTVQKACLSENLCVSTAGAHTIRFLPPLVITDDEITEGLAVFRRVLEGC